MSGPGRKRVPDNLKKLRGTDQPCRMNPAAPDYDPFEDDCPVYLIGEARAEWIRMAPLLLERGLLTEADRSAFESYCIWYSIRVSAYNSIQKKITEFEKKENKHPDDDPLIQKSFTRSGSTKRPIPELKTLRDASSMEYKWLTEFGFTPASRGKVTATKTPGGKKDPYAKPA